MGRIVKVIFANVLGLSLLVMSGCNSKTEDPVATTKIEIKPTKLNIVVVDDQPLAEGIKRFWAAEGYGEVQVMETTSKELSSSDFKVASTTDVIVMPIGVLPEFWYRDSLMPLTNEALNVAEYSRESVFPSTRNELMQIKRTTVALPLGCPTFVLMYRADILEQHGLMVPETWEQLNVVRQQLEGILAQGNLPGIENVLLEATSDEMAAYTFLARVASSCKGPGRVSSVFDFQTGAPLIDTAAFVQTLQTMVDNPANKTQRSIADIYSDLVAGKAVMGIGWPSRHFAENKTEPSSNLAVARLPGSPNWFDTNEDKWITRGVDEQSRLDFLGFDGRVVSVAKNSLQTQASIRFAVWLSSFATSRKIGIDSATTAPYLTNQLGTITAWTGESLDDEAGTQYFDALSAGQRERLSFVFPRIQGQSEYIEQLANGISSALRGELTPAESLKGVSAKWNDLHDRFGRDNQRKAIVASENL